MSENHKELSLHGGMIIPSPIARILVHGYYDGPTNGVLECRDGSVFKFDMIDGPFSMEEGLDDLRIFALAPLPPNALEQLTEAYQRYWTPRWPVWAPIWTFDDEADKNVVNQLTDQVLQQAGPVEWMIATYDLMDKIQAANRVAPELEPGKQRSTEAPQHIDRSELERRKQSGGGFTTREVFIHLQSVTTDEKVRALLQEKIDVLAERDRCATQ